MFNWSTSSSHFCPLKGLLISVILPACASVTSMAMASDKLMVEYPRVVVGETELGIRGQALFDKNPELNQAQTRKIGAGHGFNDFWFSELYAEFENASDGSEYKAEFYEWENLLRLSEPGRYWADWGVILEYSYATDEENKDAYKIMPLVQKRFSGEMLTMNYGFERNESENGTSNWQFSYGWQYRWLNNPAYEFAVEGYGQFGDVVDWAPLSQQTHQIGPALLGKLKTGPGRGWEYRVGLFFGLTNESPDQAFLASIEYEFFH
jgi:hypothetical protein